MGDMSFGIFKILAESPFYKDLLRKTSNEFFNPAVVEKEVREILNKDVEFTATLFSLMPRAANTFFGAMRGFNTYSSRFTSDALVGMLKGVAGDFDARYAAETVNEFFDEIEKLREEHPKLFAEVAGEKIREFLETLDFGKLRKFIEDTAYCSQGTFEILSEVAVANPIKLANITAAIPAVVNSGIAISNNTLQKAEMPAELLASAAFNMLESLNVEEFAKLIENQASFVNKLHEGNYILGRGEAKFKEIAEGIFERFLNNIDVEELKKAVLALLDDTRDVSEAFTNAIWRNPVVLMSLTSLIPSGINVVLNILGRVMSKFEQLPAELASQIVTAVIEEIDTKKLGEVVTAMAKTFNEILNRNSDVISATINAAISSADSKEIEKLVNNLTRSFAEVLLSNPEILTAALTPLIQSFANIVRLNRGDE